MYLNLGLLSYDVSNNWALSCVWFFKQNKQRGSGQSKHEFHLAAIGLINLIIRSLESGFHLIWHVVLWSKNVLIWLLNKKLKWKYTWQFLECNLLQQGNATVWHLKCLAIKISSIQKAPRSCFSSIFAIKPSCHYNTLLMNVLRACTTLFNLIDISKTSNCTAMFL